MGAIINEARLISQEELIELGCKIDTNSCSSSEYQWLYTTTYWTGSACDKFSVYHVFKGGGFGNYDNRDKNYRGLRPVIELSLSNF